ncbi:MAG: right-handed parallel beta-helix repeat-containing protein [Nitrospirota bacterium]
MKSGHLCAALAAFSIVVYLGLFAPGHSDASLVEGIVLSYEGPVETLIVNAYLSFSDMTAGIPAYVSTAGEKKGFYRLDLPPGEYIMTASGKIGNREFFSFHGANPIKVEEQNLWVPFMTVPVANAVVKDSPAARLNGKATFRGRPVEGAQISIYSPTDPTFRGMGFLTSSTDADGKFRFDPVPGEYVVIARKRKDFIGIRPLRKNDLFCYYPGNPVSVSSQKETEVEIPCYPKDDLESFLDEKVYPSILVKKSANDSIRLRESLLKEEVTIFTIRGRVTDRDGHPMKDLYVMAYKGTSSPMFKMLYLRTMPEYLVKTDADGYYTIHAREEGIYYMVARELIGEAPAKGENYGLFERNANHSVKIEKDSIDSVNIMVSKLMVGDKQDSEIGVGQVRAAGRDIRNHFYDGDTVIDKDTVWSGYIIIKGTLHVARNATLTVTPGTVVMFSRLDVDHDGVGDSKITVGGKLLAEGAPGNMIRFTSAEDRPGKMDWSYLLFFVSGEESVVRYCVFEYSFTGVQVHFSKAAIMDSVFTGNHEGIRFGRTELRIEHNDIHDNAYGIRHTRLEGPVEISYNNIRDNDVGIFLVPSNQNIVDFSETFDRKETLNRYQPVVTQNNIADNSLYNYRLGERQGYDILLKDNWWGAVGEADIPGTIYDGKTDSTLGNVIFKPYLKAPAETAGVRKRG